MSVIFVNQQVQFEEFLPRIQSQEVLALDLECDFDLHRYGKRLCLIQIGFTDGTIVLFDPFTLDLSKLWDIFSDPKVTKVLFGSQSDVKILKWSASCHLRGIADLFETARALGTEKPNLPMLVKEYLGSIFEKDKETQISDWNQRPLTELQIEYAAKDVVPLLGLWEKMKPLIREKRKEKQWNEKMRSLEALEFTIHDKPWLRVSGIHLLESHQQILLKYLYQARDEAARRMDLPGYKLMEPSILIEICKTPPIYPYNEDWPHFPGLIEDAQIHRVLFWFALRIGLEEIHQFRRSRP